MPYTVLGSAMVCCGVFSLGVVGPKTAMLLGQYTFFSLPSRAISRMMSRLSMFSFQAKAGSFSAVGHRADGQPSSEKEPFNPFGHIMPYEKSKAGVEHEVLKAVVEGQDVVVATSCAIIGANDFGPSRMGRMIVDYANGKLRAYLPGGFPFVAARDIVSGHLLAMDKGRTGQKYIIASEYRSTDDWMEMLERVTGRKRPVRLPTSVMLPIAMISERIVKTFAPTYPLRFTEGAVRILSMCRKADTTKARTELGFVPTRIEDAVHEAYDWFVARGAIVPLRSMNASIHLTGHRTQETRA